MVRRNDDGGTVTVFVLGLVVALVACAGLVLDGGRIVDARVESADLAAAAARAGAQQVVGLRSGARTLDPLRASAAARAFLGAAGAEGEATATTDRVVVTVRRTRRLVLLGVVGLGPRTVAATRVARPIQEVP